MIHRVKLIFVNLQEINKLMLISAVMGIGMVVARISYTNELSYAFLVWNLFLAWIPFGISSKMQANSYIQENNLLLVFIGSIWLLFYPNAPYMVTDLFHLAEIEGAPKWFDLILIMIFAWNGLIFSVLSLHDMHTMINRKIGKSLGTVFLVLIVLLTGFGVYLGRYERWNSWDLFINTRDLIGNILFILLHPAKHTAAYGFTLIFAVFIGIMYQMFYSTANRMSGKRINL